MRVQDKQPIKYVILTLFCENITLTLAFALEMVFSCFENLPPRLLVGLVDKLP